MSKNKNGKASKSSTKTASAAKEDRRITIRVPGDLLEWLEQRTTELGYPHTITSTIVMTMNKGREATKVKEAKAK